VKNILKANGLEPGPKRGAGTWDEFLKIYAATLWQCDFYAKQTLTQKGFRDLYLLIFLHVETRRVGAAAEGPFGTSRARCCEVSCDARPATAE
jgi:hypothetical protein